MSRPLRCRNGKFNKFSIYPNGRIEWTGEGEYEVTTRIAGKKKKYWQVQLMRSGKLQWFYVHRLMAYSWLGPQPHPLRNIIDHIDGDSLNNSIQNLRWVTATGNQLNKKCHGIFEQGGKFYPKIAGHVHMKYGTEDEELCREIRTLLVESYVRYSCRCPLINSCDFPHNSIHKY